MEIKVELTASAELTKVLGLLAAAISTNAAAVAGATTRSAADTPATAAPAAEAPAKRHRRTKAEMEADAAAAAAATATATAVAAEKAQPATAFSPSTGTVVAGTTTPAPAPAAPASAVDYAAVSKAVIGYAGTHGRDAALKVLAQKFKVSSAKEVPPEKWADVIAAFSEKEEELA